MQKLRLLSFFVVPTRSDGVGVEYRIGGAEGYDHLVHGLMKFSVIEGNRVLKQMFFGNVDEAAGLLAAIFHAHSRFQPDSLAPGHRIFLYLLL